MPVSCRTRSSTCDQLSGKTTRNPPKEHYPRWCTLTVLRLTSDLDHVFLNQSLRHASLRGVNALHGVLAQAEAGGLGNDLTIHSCKVGRASRPQASSGTLDMGMKSVRLAENPLRREAGGSRVAICRP